MATRRDFFAPRRDKRGGRGVGRGGGGAPGGPRAAGKKGCWGSWRRGETGRRGRVRMMAAAPAGGRAGGGRYRPSRRRRHRRCRRRLAHRYWKDAGGHTHGQAPSHSPPLSPTPLTPQPPPPPPQRQPLPLLPPPAPVPRASTAALQNTPPSLLPMNGPAPDFCLSLLSVSVSYILSQACDFHAPLPHSGRPFQNIRTRSRLTSALPISFERKRRPTARGSSGYASASTADSAASSGRRSPQPCVVPPQRQPSRRPLSGGPDAWRIPLDPTSPRRLACLRCIRTQNTARVATHMGHQFPTSSRSVQYSLKMGRDQPATVHHAPTPHPAPPSSTPPSNVVMRHPRPSSPPLPRHRRRPPLRPCHRDPLLWLPLLSRPSMQALPSPTAAFFAPFYSRSRCPRPQPRLSRPPATHPILFSSLLGAPWRRMRRRVRGMANTVRTVWVWVQSRLAL